jgi:hypothetical protein
MEPTWMILGDFNLIYMDQDKSNGHLNRRLMLRFHRTLNHLVVREIPLSGKCFTWSNEQNTPTMTQIDCVFCTIAWEEVYSYPLLRALSSSSSDHCPLLLCSQECISTPSIFRFEAH